MVEKIFHAPACAVSGIAVAEHIVPVEHIQHRVTLIALIVVVGQIKVHKAVFACWWIW